MNMPKINYALEG